MINKELLDILACPKCKGQVELTERADGLVCESCQLMYEIRDDIRCGSPWTAANEHEPDREWRGERE